jgi:hypothetical protein
MPDVVPIDKGACGRLSADAKPVQSPLYFGVGAYLFLVNA